LISFRVCWLWVAGINW